MVTMTPPQRAIYQRVLRTAKAIGPFKEDPTQVDAEIRSWLKAAMELAQWKAQPTRTSG